MKELRGTVRLLVLGIAAYAAVWLYGVAWQRYAVPEGGEQTAAASVLWTGGKTSVADWVVSGAGDASYNGDYSSAGTHNGKAYYIGPAPANDRNLYWDGAMWALGPAFDPITPYYHGTGADLPANPWVVEDGTAPAPTLSSGLPDTYLSIPRGQLLQATGTKVYGLRVSIITPAETVRVQCALYDASFNLLGTTQEIEFDEAGGPVQNFYFTGGAVTVTAATDLYAMAWANDPDVDIVYKVGSGFRSEDGSPTYDTWSDPISLTTSAGFAAAITLIETPVILPDGIASAEAWGTPRLVIAIAPQGIASEETWGTAIVQEYHIQFDLNVDGIPSGEEWGWAVVTRAVDPVPPPPPPPPPVRIRDAENCVFATVYVYTQDGATVGLGGIAAWALEQEGEEAEFAGVLTDADWGWTDGHHLIDIVRYQDRIYALSGTPYSTFGALTYYTNLRLYTVDVADSHDMALVGSYIDLDALMDPLPLYSARAAATHLEVVGNRLVFAGVQPWASVPSSRATWFVFNLDGGTPTLLSRTILYGSFGYLGGGVSDYTTWLDGTDRVIAMPDCIGTSRQIRRNGVAHVYDVGIAAMSHITALDDRVTVRWARVGDNLFAACSDVQRLYTIDLQTGAVSDRLFDGGAALCAGQQFGEDALFWRKATPSTAVLQAWSHNEERLIYREDPGRADNLLACDIDVVGGYVGRKVDDATQTGAQTLGWVLYSTEHCGRYPGSMEAGRVAWGVTRTTPVGGTSLRSYGRGFIAGTFHGVEVSDPHFRCDRAGRLWCVLCCDNAVRVYHRDSPQREWERHGDAFTGAYSDPEIVCLGTGELIVVATPRGGYSQIAKSSDDGASWAVVT